MSIFIIVSFYKILPIRSPVTLYSESLPVKIPYLLCFGNCPSSIDLPIVIYSCNYWFDFPDTSQPPIPQYTPSLYPFPQAMETGSVLKLEIQKFLKQVEKNGSTGFNQGWTAQWCWSLQKTWPQWKKMYVINIVT